MECPVCYKTVRKSAVNSVILECSHVFCDKCACKWIIQEKTCPICRANSNHFDRQTRSKKRAEDLSKELSDLWNAIMSIFDNDIPIVLFVGLLDKFFAKDEYKGIWHRPEMNLVKHNFKSLCYLIKEEHVAVLDNKQVDIVTKFLFEM